METYLVNATLYTPYERIVPGTVVLRDGRIAAVGPSNVLRPPASAQVIDVAGAAVTPGLIDIHMHGVHGYDAMGEGLIEVARLLPRYGVTAFVPTTLTFPWEEVLARLRVMADAFERVNEGAQPLGIHIEGPHLSPRKPGMANAAWMRPLSHEDWETLQRTARGHIRMITFAPEEGEAASLIPRLRSEGVIPVIGHSDARFDQVGPWVDAGLCMATHTYNAMRGLHHREPGVLGAVMHYDAIVAQLIADGHHVHPAALDILIRVKGPERVALISDAAPLAGSPPGEYEWGSYHVVVDGETVRLPNGTLAGAYALLDTGIRTLMEKVGCSPEDAFVMAATTPARSLGVLKGELRPGFDADLVVWSREWQPIYTYVRGQLAYQADEHPVPAVGEADQH